MNDTPYYRVVVHLTVGPWCIPVTLLTRERIDYHKAEEAVYRWIHKFGVPAIGLRYGSFAIDAREDADDAAFRSEGEGR